MPSQIQVYMTVSDELKSQIQADAEHCECSVSHFLRVAYRQARQTVRTILNGRGPLVVYLDPESGCYRLVGQGELEILVPGGQLWFTQEGESGTKIRVRIQ